MRQSLYAITQRQTAVEVHIAKADTAGVSPMAKATATRKTRYSAGSSQLIVLKEPKRSSAVKEFFSNTAKSDITVTTAA